uniref:Uncharacterized protein n=2 Tax=Timema TaxID=61471 RepID=A0A7R9D2C8_TIMPO|nr:unnamed protein product [Timema douglasi]CAD7406822.1 unnamed protein product [Timema poppensis]
MRCKCFYQVTITAEQECLYLCWSRLKLERVLRHRPLFKVLFSNIIGKDITHKLYSLNEHLDTSKNDEGRSNLGCHSDYWKTMNRSLSVDAVHTGTQGHVRSLVWRTQNQRRASITNSDRSSPGKNKQFHYWVPVIADQFPATSPFTTYFHTVAAAPTTTPQISQLILPQVLGSQPPISQLQSSFHNSAEREEKFETPV